MRDKFKFYKSYYEAIKKLPDNEQLEVLEAIMRYSLNEELVELKGNSKLIFDSIKPQLDINNKKYDKERKNYKWNQILLF